MRLIPYLPSAPLNRYVERLWWSQRDRAGDCTEHTLPGGSVQMLFALHDEPMPYSPGSSPREPLQWSRAIVHGPQSSHYKTAPKPPGTIVGISFRPGMAGSVLGVPLGELTDCHVAVDVFWGARGRDVRDRLLGATGPQSAFRILEDELVNRLRPRPVHPAVGQALAFRPGAGASVHVADIQRAVGYSPRHFVALFRGAVGLTPKHYYRIQRFTAVVQSLAATHTRSLADLAAFVGYSDQAHLTRDFREFAGITPTQYRPRDSASILHHRAHHPELGATREVRNLQDCPDAPSDH